MGPNNMRQVSSGQQAGSGVLRRKIQLCNDALSYFLATASPS